MRILQPRNPLDPLPRGTKASRRLNPSYDQLVSGYRFRATTPYQMNAGGMELEAFYKVSIRKYDSVGGETVLRWAFKTRSARDRFVHTYGPKGARRA